MKKQSQLQLLIILLISILSISFTKETEATRAIPDNNLSYPVLITLENNRTASGFYLNTGTHTYFVTARHVLFDNKFKLISKKADLLSYPLGINDRGKILLQLDLMILNDTGKIKFDKIHDVAIIRIGVATVSDENKILKFITGVKLKEYAPSGLLGVGISNIKKFEDVLTANEIIIFGYPTSLGIKNIPQIDYERPLLRKGIVAGKNNKFKTIILDCPVYKGNSGGPVMEIEQIKFGANKYRIIGMIVGFVPYAEKWENKTHGYSNLSISNSDYSIAEPMDIVLDLLWE